MPKARARKSGSRKQAHNDGIYAKETLPLRPFCRSCIIATCGYDFRKGQVPPYVVMLSYCLGISRGNPEGNTG